MRYSEFVLLALVASSAPGAALPVSRFSTRDVTSGIDTRDIHIYGRADEEDQLQRQKGWYDTMTSKTATAIKNGVTGCVAAFGCAAYAYSTKNPVGKAAGVAGGASGLYSAVHSGVEMYAQHKDDQFEAKKQSDKEAGEARANPSFLNGANRGSSRAPSSGSSSSGSSSSGSSRQGVSSITGAQRGSSRASTSANSQSGSGDMALTSGYQGDVPTSFLNQRPKKTSQTVFDSGSGAGSQNAAAAGTGTQAPETTQNKGNGRATATDDKGSSAAGSASVTDSKDQKSTASRWSSIWTPTKSTQAKTKTPGGNEAESKASLAGESGQRVTTPAETIPKAADDQTKAATVKVPEQKVTTPVATTPEGNEAQPKTPSVKSSSSKKLEKQAIRND